MRKSVSLFTTIALMFSLLLFATGCQSNSKNGISAPKALNSKMQAALSQTEQDALTTFISELVTAYNTGDNDTPLNRTDAFSSAFSQIKTMAQNNDTLSDASTKGFLIVMSATMGTISPGESSTPEELREYIKEQICAIIEIYCKQVSGGDFRSPPFPIYPDTSGFQ